MHKDRASLRRWIVAGGLGMDITELRIRIDEVDEQILKLLNRRAGYALKIGHIKRIAGLEVYVPERERQVLAHVQDENLGPLSDGAVKRLFERIIDESRRLEQERVAEEKKRLASGETVSDDGAEGEEAPGR